MRALPLAVALALAALIAPSLLRALLRAGHARPNYRARTLPFPFGVLVPAAALLSLTPLTLIGRAASERVFEPRILPVAVYALGVLCLGLIDDAFGSAPQGGQPRGVRGHAAALARGELTTGALKAGGSLGLALFAMHSLGLSSGRWLLAAAVLVLATNALNLLDLRPGRSGKAFVTLAASLTIGSGSLVALWTLGLFAGPALVACAYDLRERAMLGDAGSGLLGALAGLWLVLTLSSAGQLVALALLVLFNLYGELRSLSALVESVPVLRELDSWGRPS